MRTCFADTAYFVALVNPDDEWHHTAVTFTRNFKDLFVTTSAVLNELGNHLSDPANRPLFLETIDRINRNLAVQVIHVDQRLFASGIALYRARPDKHWSLTDCISFVVMTERQMDDVLTTDHHFEQAGFRVVL